MNPNNTHDRLLEQSYQIDLIGKELRWILEECQKRNIQPETPMGNEMRQKFNLLYRDFKKVHLDTCNLSMHVHQMKFEDRTIGLIYCATADLLVRKIDQGIFAQFTSVAEHGCLPDGTSLDDLSP